VKKEIASTERQEHAGNTSLWHKELPIWIEYLGWIIIMAELLFIAWF
jgi:hypothetical protein